jgi:hypothetical protein
MTELQKQITAKEEKIGELSGPEMANVNDINNKEEI